MFDLEVRAKSNPGPMKQKAKSARVGVFWQGFYSLIKRETARSPAL